MNIGFVLILYDLHTMASMIGQMYIDVMLVTHVKLKIRMTYSARL